MPNWCYNRLTIHGALRTRNALERLLHHTDEAGETFRLGNAHPTPAELCIEATSAWETIPEVWAEWVTDGSWTQDEYDKRVKENSDLLAKYKANREKYGYDNWYEWNIANWGTKWSPLLECWDNSHGRTHAYCESAWSPPSLLLAHISKRFPSLMIINTYDEEGMGFVGCEAFVAGEVVAEEGSDFSDLPEKFRERYDKLLDRMSDGSDEDVWDDKDNFEEELRNYFEKSVYRTIRSLGINPSRRMSKKKD